MSLPYQKAILEEAKSQDGLWILAKGLGILEILNNLVETYEEHKNLVVVLNVLPSDLGPVTSRKHVQIDAEYGDYNLRFKNWKRKNLFFFHVSFFFSLDCFFFVCFYFFFAFFLSFSTKGQQISEKTRICFFESNS